MFVISSDPFGSNGKKWKAYYCDFAVLQGLANYNDSSIADTILKSAGSATPPTSPLEITIAI